jgi:uncharacterized protein YPO0396
MSGEQIGTLVAVVTLILGFIAAVVGTFKYFSAQDERLREKIDEAEQRAVLLIDKMQDGATKTLTSLQTSLQAADVELRRDLAALGERLNTLSLDAVRKTDLSALEQRLNQVLSREVNTVMDALREIKQERQAHTLRLENKIDQIMATVVARMAKSDNSPTP